MPFELMMRDNHSHMVGSCDRLDPESGCPACAQCGYRTDPDYTTPGFVLRQKRDVSCCYDGAIIVSERFRELAEAFGNAHLVFAPLPRARGYYHLKTSRPVPVDPAAMGTRFERPCAGCGRFLDVVGCVTVVLAPGARLAAGEANLSDLYFGSNNEAAPMLLAGDAFTAACRDARFTGIDRYDPFAA